MIKLIIFDYDGVIVDSFPNTYETYKVIAKKLNKKFPKNIDEFRKIYGYSYTECYKNLGIVPSEHELAERIYKEESAKLKPILCEGIEEVLKTLKKSYPLVLLTANYRQNVITKLKSFNLSKYFDSVIGKVKTETLPLSKTEEFIKIMKDYYATQDETIIIGDREIDYHHAQEAGIKNIIIVKYGWGYDKKKLKG